MPSSSCPIRAICRYLGRGGPAASVENTRDETGLRRCFALCHRRGPGPRRARPVLRGLVEGGGQPVRPGTAGIAADRVRGCRGGLGSGPGARLDLLHRDRRTPCPGRVFAEWNQVHLVREGSVGGDAGRSLRSNPSVGVQRRRFTRRDVLLLESALAATTDPQQRARSTHRRSRRSGSARRHRCG